MLISRACSRYCTTLAQEAAGISRLRRPDRSGFLQTLECCAPLHDIGNVGLPDHILLKGRQARRGGNSDHANATRRSGPTPCKHVVHRFGPRVGFLSMAIDIARHHHEHYDGTGYPDRLAGNDIPLAARLLTIADCL